VLRSKTVRAAGKQTSYAALAHQITHIESPFGLLLAAWQVDPLFTQVMRFPLSVQRRNNQRLKVGAIELSTPKAGSTPVAHMIRIGTQSEQLFWWKVNS